MRIRLWAGAAICAAAITATTAQGASTIAIFMVAGGNGSGFKGDGKLATSASLNGPAGLAVGADGAVLVADTIDQRIRRIDSTGQKILTIAGNGDRGFGGDGRVPSVATFQDPTALAVGKDGSLFLADTANNRIRVIRPSGTVATVAGTGESDPAGDDGAQATATTVNGPAGLAVDPAGQLFYSDTGNNRVRVIRADGTVATVAGTGVAGATGDGGPARAAQLKAPAGLAVAADGALLIADSGNNRIRRVAPDGTITTVAGTGGGGSGGDGGPATAAQLNLPVDVAAMPQGGFFVAEQGGNRVRRVDAQGTITRVAGTGGPRYGGDGRAAAGSLLNAPHAVELMPSGSDLLIADTDNNRVRYVAIPGQASLLAIAPLKTSIRAPLVKVTREKHHVLVVRDVKIAFRVTKEADLTLRIRTKRGRPVKTLKTHVGPGEGAVHLPAALRSGKHRLTKDHYVVGVIAKSGTASAASSVELVVK